jgi:hypothetical protein
MSVLEGTERKYSFVAAQKPSDRPVSLVIVGGLLRAIDLGLIGLSAVLVHFLYLPPDPAAWHYYFAATAFAILLGGPLYHCTGLYRLLGCSASHLKLGTLAGSRGGG